MDIKKILFKTNSIDVEKALPDAIIYISKDGKIQWVNDVASDLFKTSKIHLLTSNINDFIENAMNLITTSIANDKSVLAKSPEDEVYYDMTSREIDEGYVIDLRKTASVPEIEDEKNAEPVINREKNNFLLKLSNDIKAPIQSIVGFSQAMSEGLGGCLSEQQDKYIRIINKNSSELMYFIEKLLYLSKSEAINSVPQNKPFDVIALINSVVKFNEQLYKDKDINITVNSDELEKRTITTDSEMLKEMLQNIFEVIIKSVEMGDIVIKIQIPDDEFIFKNQLQNGNYIHISLSSNALLLTENDLECMFDPYKIVDSTNRKNVLRAIILASVKNIASNLKGIVWVESQILKSTSFNIIVPVQ